MSAQDPPALPGEMFRHGLGDSLLAIDRDGTVVSSTHNGWVTPSAYEVTMTLRAWALAERSRADAAEAQASKLAEIAGAYAETAAKNGPAK